MRLTRLFIALIGAGFASQANAQSASEALASQWNTICITAVDGTLLAVRCDETATSTAADPNMIAAVGQRLEEVPGQARITSRDYSDIGSPPVAGGASGDASAAAIQPRADGGLSLNVDEPLGAHWSLFLSGEFGRMQRRDSDIEAAFDARTATLTAGVHWQPSPDWLLGLALNHMQESLDYRGTAGRLDTRYSGLLVTVSRNFGDHWSLDAYAGWFAGGYDIEREIDYTLPVGSSTVSVYGMAAADPDAARRVHGLAGNGLWSRNGWNHGVGFGYDYSETRIDGFTESSTVGLGAVIGERHLPVHRGHVEYGLSRALSQDWGVWQPLLRLRWFHEFDTRKRRLSMRLAEDVANNIITFDTTETDANWGEIAVGSVFVFTRGHSGFVQLQQRIGHAFLSETSLALGWRVEL